MIVEFVFFMLKNRYKKNYKFKSFKNTNFNTNKNKTKKKLYTQFQKLHCKTKKKQI